MNGSAMPTLRRIVIAGAGQAGLWCAKTLRLQGFSGSITLVGDEPYPPYDRPPLSKSVLAGEALPASTYYLSLEELLEQDINFQAGETVASIDRARKIVSTARNFSIPYDHLVLATGARVRRLSMSGADQAEVHYLRGIDDCLMLQKAIFPGRRVLVFGGGLIGLEVAAAATKLGAQATVVEVADRVMARIVGPEVSRFFEDLHRRKGVEILTGRMSKQIRAMSGGCGIDFEDGGRTEGDLIVAGIGVIPNDTIAAEAGLKTGNGIWVDEFGRTSDPDISSVGDVANHFNPLLGRRVRLETWQNAKSQAISVARNLSGEIRPYVENPWGWSDQFGVNLQLLGMPEKLEGGVIRGSIQEGTFSIFYLKDGRIDGVVSVNAVRDISASRRLMAERVRVEPTSLEDTTIPMKSFIGG